MKIIKRRIESVGNTKQIMKAMNLVAASKLQKVKAQMDNIRPLFSNIKLVMDGIKSSKDMIDNVFVEKRDVKSIAYVVITSDRGLCGGYNINVAKKALSHINENKDKEEKIIAVGAKGLEYLRRRKKNVVQRFRGVTDESVFEDAESIGGQILSMYTSGEVDEVYIVYTRFITLMAHEPNIIRILPVGIDQEAGEQDVPVPDASGYTTFMFYEPDVNTFMTYAMPMYLNTSVYGAMVESAVCEQASRMTSMDAATRNATEILDDLTLDYNRKRQGMITQEITEIVSGANALQ
jgi:F-type H+-transporting ATPase subunit gamma